MHAEISTNGYGSDNHALSYVNAIINICDSKGPVSVMICIY